MNFDSLKLYRVYLASLSVPGRFFGGNWILKDSSKFLKEKREKYPRRFSRPPSLAKRAFHIVVAQ